MKHLQLCFGWSDFHLPEEGSIIPNRSGLLGLTSSNREWWGTDLRKTFATGYTRPYTPLIPKRIDYIHFQTEHSWEKMNLQWKHSALPEVATQLWKERGTFPLNPELNVGSSDHTWLIKSKKKKNALWPPFPLQGWTKCLFAHRWEKSHSSFSSIYSLHTSLTSLGNEHLGTNLSKNKHPEWKILIWQHQQREISVQPPSNLM